jgi:hypothetical protein
MSLWLKPTNSIITTYGYRILPIYINIGSGGWNQGGQGGQSGQGGQGGQNGGGSGGSGGGYFTGPTTTPHPFAYPLPVARLHLVRR